LLEESRELHQDRQRNQQMLATLQAMQSRYETQEQETQRRLQNELDETKRDLYVIIVITVKLTIETEKNYAHSLILQIS